MKAQEYFEKYFEKIETIEDVESISDNTRSMLQEMAMEITEINTRRHGKTLTALVGVVREINEKWNSVAAKVERKFKTKVIRRNVIWNTVLALPYPDEFPRKAD